MGNLITLHDVEKRYGTHVILKAINLEINKGDSIALTGHIDYAKDIKISYVPEHFPKLNMTALRYVTSMARIIGLDKAEAEKRSRELFETFYTYGQRTK